jgi:hypothetical protein
MIAESISQIPLILGPKRSMAVLAEDSDRSDDRRAVRVAARRPVTLRLQWAIQGLNL